MKYFNLKDYFQHIPQDDVRKICTPLAKNFGLTYFFYCRVYQNNSRFLLTSHPEFAQWVYENNHSIASTFHQNINAGYYFTLQTKTYLSTNDIKKHDSQAIGSRNYFEIDINQGFTIVERQKHYCEIFDFACPPYTNISPDFYTSNMDVLKHFIRYFRDKAKNLIALSNQYRISNPNLVDLYGQPLREPSPPVYQSAKEAFYSQTQLRSYPIICLNKRTQLSEREIECLICLVRGKTAGETSRLLRISAKTVEAYLSSAKDKLRCTRKSQLIDKVFELDLIDTEYLKWLIKNERKK